MKPKNFPGRKLLRKIQAEARKEGRYYLNAVEEKQIEPYKWKRIFKIGRR